MKSGTRLVLGLLAAALAVAILRTVCVPVGSFRAGLDRLRTGMPADSVVAILGRPNRICVDGRAERWVYTDRPPPDEPPRLTGPDCGAPTTASELAFDADGRLLRVVREAP